MAVYVVYLILQLKLSKLIVEVDLITSRSGNDPKYISHKLTDSALNNDIKLSFSQLGSIILKKLQLLCMTDLKFLV